MLGNPEICGVVENCIDPAQQPHHQRLDQVGVLRAVDSLEVEALDPPQLQLIVHVVEDCRINAVCRSISTGSDSGALEAVDSRGGDSPVQAGTCL